jgi:transcriptional regulator with XRE-family HTH domain
MLAALTGKIKRPENIFRSTGATIRGMQDDPSFGARLREARKRRHLTQRQVGDTLGITHSSVGQWETGATVPELETLVAAAELYETSLDWLVWGGEVGSGLENRIRRIPSILRAALVQRLHKEIDQTEEAANRLPPEMTNGAAVKDRDPRLSQWSAASKQRPARKRKTQ